MLIGNYNILEQDLGRRIGGESYPTTWLHGEIFQNFWFGEHVIDGETEKAGFAPGYNDSYSFALPPTAGGLSSHFEGNISVTPTGLAVGGKPTSGSTSITFSITATGGLIVSGSGSASITLSPTGTLISVAAGSGSATITLSGSALIGALAGISGQSSITLTPTATIRAVGYLAGLSTNETEFSADALARAVWDAVAADFNISGTMGEKLNAAGTAGDPWTAAIAGYAPGTAGAALEIAKKVIANNLTKTGDTVVIKDDDETTDFITYTSTATERTKQ